MSHFVSEYPAADSERKREILGDIFLEARTYFRESGGSNDTTRQKVEEKIDAVKSTFDTDQRKLISTGHPEYFAEILQMLTIIDIASKYTFESLWCVTDDDSSVRLPDVWSDWFEDDLRPTAIAVISELAEFDDARAKEKLGCTEASGKAHLHKWGYKSEYLDLLRKSLSSDWNKSRTNPEFWRSKVRRMIEESKIGRSS
jgi:hypothetical protein